MKVSERLTQVPASPIRKLVPFATAAKKSGVHVYHLNIGDPDIETPEVMLSALTGWKRNPIGYAQSQGETAFLDALVSYYHGLGHTFITPNDIQVTTGGSEAISMAMFSVAGPGDEIIVFEPFYANYNSYAVINGIRLVPIPTSIKDGFHLPPANVIERYLTKKTRAILFCNPNNPTGTVYGQKEVEGLLSVAKKHDLYLLSDEVYREFVYDGRTHTSLLSYMEHYPDRLVVLDSLSKRYSLCGARLGNVVSKNRDLMAGILRIAQGRLSSGLVDQSVGAMLTKVPQSYLSGVNSEYVKRRDLLYEGLLKIPGVTIPKPEGAFYSIVGLPVDDAEKFATWLLTDFRDRNETVMVAPAAGFYASAGRGKNEVRIAYVLNLKSIARCIELLSKALVQYTRRQE